MIGFWLAAAALTAITVLLLLRPLMRPPAVQAGTSDFARTVYKDQVAEIERDLARGVLTAEQARQARAEVGRRLLSAAAEAEQATPPTTTAKPARLLALVLTGVVPVVALAVYLPLGRPDLPAQPFALRADTRQTVPDNVLKALESLERKLQENPDDLQGWALAAATYTAMGRHADAAEAWRRAVGLSQGDPAIVGNFAEALVAQADGIVGEEARRAFEAVLVADPREPRARYYLGVARQQAGDPKGAIDRWAALIKDSPADAPWVPHLRTRIHDVAVEVGLDPVALTPEPLPPAGTAPPALAGPRVGAAPPAGGPVADAGGAPNPGAANPGAANPGAAGPALTPEQMQAMAAMTPEEQKATIQSMVDGLAARLEENPADVDGWLRLARARGVLGDQPGVLAALERATTAAPDRADVWMAYARATAPVGDQAPGPAFLSAMGRVLALEPQNPQALFYLGAAAAQAGRVEEAKDLWGRLLARIPADSPDHADLKGRIDALGR